MVPITALLPLLIGWTFLSISDAQLVINGIDFEVVEFIDSQTFPLDSEGALVTLDYFLSLTESNANTTPPELFLLLETWTTDDNELWAINSTEYKNRNNKTIPWAMSRLVGIISGQAYEDLCMEYHLSNFCPTKGCYVPSLVFYDQNDILRVFELFTSNFLNVTVLSFEPNAWKWFCVTNPFIIFYSTFFAAVFAIPIFLGIYIIYRKCEKAIAKGEFEVNFSLVCLVLEIISNILRVALVIDDPFTFKAILSVETLHVPFGIIIGILLIFIWQDITRRKSNTQHHPFLSDKFRYPAVGLCSLIAVLELVALIYPLCLGQSFNNVYYYLIYTAIYVFCYAALAIFYFVTSFRVYKLLNIMKKNASSSSDRKEKDIQQLTFKVVASGVGMVLTCAGAIGLLFSDVPTCMFAFTSWYLGLAITSIATVLAFAPRNLKDKLSSSSQPTEKSTGMKQTSEFGVEDEKRTFD